MTLKSDWTFKSHFQDRLERGTDHGELLALVRTYKARGLSQREAYDQLQELWMEFGFDDDDGEDDPIRDNLEYVMQIVWGFCPDGARIWEDSLSTHNQPT